jgi:hypothetical protein
MERELWPLLYQVLQDTARGFRQKYVHHQPWVIAAVLLWAALHDRPVAWACRAPNWSTTELRPDRLPSPSAVSRRDRRTAFGLFLNELTRRLRGAGLPGLLVVLDGKPLVVGGCSHDPDARFGRAAGHLGKGYKLHAAWGSRPMPEAWEVTPLNEHEIGPAGRLLAGLPGGYALADANYDATALFDHAGACNYQLLAEQVDANPGAGHHYQSPYRLRCIAMLRGPSPFGRELFRRRADIERAFGQATSFGGGMAPLPAWVRRRHRVNLWVWAKLAINAARIRYRQRLQARLQ